MASVVIGLLSTWVSGNWRADAARREPGASNAATLALGARGFSAEAVDVHWVDPPHERRGFLSGEYRFAVLTRRSNEPTDVWLGVARLSLEGRWMGLEALYNLSDTSAVAETSLSVSGERVAWHVSNADEIVAVKVVDLGGQKAATDQDLTWIERWQMRLTYLQETGQLVGWCKGAYRFRQPRARVESTWTAAGLQVESQGKTAVLHCDSATANGLGLETEPSGVGSPGDLVTWAVDRVRALPWFGSDRMQWVKAVAFNALDRVYSVKRRIVRSDGASQLDDAVSGFLPAGAAPSFDPETGWPPSPMTPLLTPPLPSEGVFRPLDDDAFAVPQWGGPSPFAFSFLRPEPARPESQIFVVLWDPRLLELHTMTGTREPKTATGETGAGTVPREDGTIARLAAAFNGGFQATHGEFGMMAQRVVYLPPKPYAATIAEQADGSVGFGTWPNDDAIPEGIVGFRQNLTPLLSDGVVNPYGRSWWGGVPPGWQDATRTVRTGLCLTGEQFVAYFYGSTINSDHLSKAMVAARCVYGVHLDMNPGHTGFEFYRVARAGTLPTLARKLDSNWQIRGSVPGASEWEFLGRRMLKTMHLMHFPRYVRTDSRDFFYLTHRHVLPPRSTFTSTHPEEAKPGTWQTKEHAQRGFPPAIATSSWRPDRNRPGLEAEVLMLDAKWATPCSTNCTDAAPIARMHRTSKNSDIGIYYHARRFSLTNAQMPAGAIPIAFGKDEAHVTKATAAVGIAHHDWLCYAEIVRGGDRLHDAPVLKRLLTDLGCDNLLYLEQPIEVSLGNEERSSRHFDLTWQRDAAPIAARIFRDTSVVPPDIWQPLQSKRVRYVRQRTSPLNIGPAPRGNRTPEAEPSSVPDSIADSTKGDAPPAQ